MRNARSAFPFIAALLVLMWAGTRLADADGYAYGGDASAAPAASTAPAASPVSAAFPASSPSPPAVIVVKVSGLGFQPAKLTVHPGDRITWSNDDLIVHTVTAKDGSFNSGDLPGGKSWTLVAQKRGTVQYACRYHPNMVGTLVIQ